jgi:4-hydroxy-2-oxoheptanedioate aldolase
VTDRLKQLWSDGKTAFGAWIMYSGTAAAEMIALVGFDYVCVDCQHGLLGVEDMRDILIALHGAETTPFVRVPANDPSWIGKALDAGAEGIIVPLVNSRAEAEQAVAGCRFPPAGVRSLGLARGHQPFGRDTFEINRKVLCFPMIETRQALDAAGEICSTPGVDGVYIGPSDLALSLGLAPRRADVPPEHAEAVERIRGACEETGIVAGIHTYNGTEARHRAEQGFGLVTVTADAALLASGALTELGKARA